jgi:hypothetical protein
MNNQKLERATWLLFELRLEGEDMDAFLMGNRKSTVHEVGLTDLRVIAMLAGHRPEKRALQPLLVQVQPARRTGLAPVQGRDRTQLHWAEAALPASRCRAEILLDESPRWQGRSMGVGPLVRVLMLYASGNEQARELVGMTLMTLDVPVDALFSILGRTAAHPGIEASGGRSSRAGVIG